MRAGAVIMYRLRFPNLETRFSFNDFVLSYLTGQESEKAIFQSEIYEFLAQGDLSGFERILKSLFASIPYTNYVNNTIKSYEGYYASVIYAYLASLGLDIVPEEVTNRGRIDLTLRLEDFIYILEFKVNGKGRSLEQIREKDYARKYMDDGRTVYLVGIDFDSDERNLSGFEWEKCV